MKIKSFFLLLILSALSSTIHAQNELTFTKMSLTEYNDSKSNKGLSCYGPSYWFGDIFFADRLVVSADPDHKSKTYIQLKASDRNQSCEGELADKITIFEPGTSLDIKLMSIGEKVVLIRGYNSSTGEILSLHAVNNRGQVLWQTKWDFQYNGKKLTPLNVNIDDKGNALFFVRAKVDGERSHAMLYRDVNTGKVKNIPFSLELSGRINFKTTFDYQGNIHFMGSYDRSDEKTTGEDKRGIFHGSVDPQTDEALKTRLFPFGDIDRYASRWEIDNFHVEEDGSIALVGYGIYAKKGPGKDFCKLYFMKLSPEGEVVWKHMIPVINLAKKDGYYGTREFWKMGQHYGYSYVDNTENATLAKGIDLSNKKTNTEPKQDQVQLFIISPDGTVAKRGIMPYKDFDMIHLNKIDNRLVFYPKKNSKHPLVKISW